MWKVVPRSSDFLAGVAGTEQMDAVSCTWIIVVSSSLAIGRQDKRGSRFNTQSQYRQCSIMTSNNIHNNFGYNLFIFIHQTFVFITKQGILQLYLQISIFTERHLICPIYLQRY